MVDHLTPFEAEMFRWERDGLLHEIDMFLQRTGMKESYLGLIACRNGHLITRLRAGGKIHYETLVKLRSFMEWRLKEGKRYRRRA